MKNIHILPFFFIALYQYTSIAVKSKDESDDSNPNLRTYSIDDGIDIVTSEEDGKVIYTFVSGARYKTGKFVDGDTILFCVRRGDKFIFVNFNWPEDNNKPLTITFKYLFSPLSGIREFIYTLHNDTLKRIFKQSQNFNSMKEITDETTPSDRMELEHVPLITEGDQLCIDTPLFVDEDDHGKLIMGSFFNKQGIRIRTYASRVKNPKGHVILVHGIRAHFRSDFCKYNTEWYQENVGEYPNPDALELFERESKDIFPDLESLNKDGVVNDDPLHGKNAFDLTPRFKYEGSFLHLINKLGYSAYGLDLQSHGLSGGIDKQRCYVEQFDDYAYDVMQFVSIVKRGRFNDSSEKWDEQLVFSNDRHDNLPYYIGGLSIGGSIVLKAQVLFSLTTKGDIKFIDSMTCMSTMLNMENYYTRLNLLLQPFVRIYASIAPKLPVMLENIDGYADGIELCMRYNVS